MYKRQASNGTEPATSDEASAKPKRTTKKATAKAETADASNGTEAAASNGTEAAAAAVAIGEDKPAPAKRTRKPAAAVPSEEVTS